MPTLVLPTSATDTEINHVNLSRVQSLLAFHVCAAFPGARTGYIYTSFVPQLGAIGPVSLLLARHSWDEAGQWNSVGFQAHAEGGGWLGARNSEHKAVI